MSGELAGLRLELTNRGTYCLLVVATLLDIITPELLHNVDKFIAACQTYEGGFACSSWAFEDTQRVAMAEAHGGYTSCSVFSHFLLSSVQPPKRLESLPKSYPIPIDVDSALRWGALMQGEAGEAGGFRGRSNKLVDGCYSWWVGGTFPILEELHRREAETKSVKPNGTTEAKLVPIDDDGEDEWADEPSMHALFNRGMSTTQWLWANISRAAGVCSPRGPETRGLGRWAARQTRQETRLVPHVQQPVRPLGSATPLDALAYRGREAPRRFQGRKGLARRQAHNARGRMEERGGAPGCASRGLGQRPRMGRRRVRRHRRWWRGQPRSESSKSESQS